MTSTTASSLSDEALAKLRAKPAGERTVLENALAQAAASATDPIGGFQSAMK